MVLHIFLLATANSSIQHTKTSYEIFFWSLQKMDDKNNKTLKSITRSL